MGRLAFVIGSALLLQACVSGGSGRGRAPIAPPGDIPLVITGAAQYQTYQEDPVTGQITLKPNSVETAPESTLTVTSNTLTVDAGGSSVDFDRNNGDTIEPDKYGTRVKSADGSRIGNFVTIYSGAYAYQSFGAWLTGAGTSEMITAVGSFGGASPTETLPDAGSFEYRGSLVGFHADDSGIHGAAADIALSVNFTAGNFTVDSENSVTWKMNPGGGWDGVTPADAPHLDFSGISGTITGSQLSAEIKTNVEGSAPMSGTVNGTFYGTGAAEVGGTFQMGGPGGTYTGAFGAAQVAPTP